MHLTNLWAKEIEHVNEITLILKSKVKKANGIEGTSRWFTRRILVQSIMQGSCFLITNQ